jgi:hypothetical protein
MSTGPNPAQTDTTLGLLRAASGARAATRMVATSVATGRLLISKSDLATQEQSAFDRCARLGLPQAKHVVDEATYLDFLTTQVAGWETAEIAQLQSILSRLAPVFAGIDMDLPEIVYLVKTTGREEGSSAYTRNLDTIVLPANMVASLRAPPPGGDDLHPADSTAFLAGVVTHELFHILSKNNPALRSLLYAVLGYRELPAALTLPDDPAPCGLPYSSLKVTNPDAPSLNVAIDLVAPGQTVVVPMVPVLISERPYEGGDFFATMDWSFLEVDVATGRWLRNSDGSLRLHASDDLKSQYLAKVGRNLTEELFHPDEILAQSFVLAAPEPSLPLLQRVSGMIWPDRSSISSDRA